MAEAAASKADKPEKEKTEKTEKTETAAFVLRRCGSTPVPGVLRPAPETFSVRHGQRLAFGREDTCDVVLRHQHVSKVHATFVLQKSPEGVGHMLLMQDGSSNGTWINGAKMTPGRFQQLDAGDRISFLAPTESLEEDPATWEVCVGSAQSAAEAKRTPDVRVEKLEKVKPKQAAAKEKEKEAPRQAVAKTVADSRDVAREGTKQVKKPPAPVKPPTTPATVKPAPAPSPAQGVPQGEPQARPKQKRKIVKEKPTNVNGKRPAEAAEAAETAADAAAAGAAEGAPRPSKLRAAAKTTQRRPLDALDAEAMAAGYAALAAAYAQAAAEEDLQVEVPVLAAAAASAARMAEPDGSQNGTAAKSAQASGT
ncbi:unnamed protein product [Effrenium voratum]|uniref:FHA domain-containing protein n=1 Tax=Effrenium voratum TaxID=2562239 RepID=A0AA36JPA0_9DINO|nr:unnamed protein product [Effrenium voratum]